MKKDIHPTYYPTATISCACGNVVTTGSSVPEMSVEICAACHPFYTGQEKLVDTRGRVERFRARAAQAKPERPKSVKREKKSPTKKAKEA